MARIQRARQLATARAGAKRKQIGAEAIALRAITEAEVARKEQEAAIQLGVDVFETGSQVAKVKEEFNLARKGGYEGNILKFLTEPEETAEAIVRGKEAELLGKEFIYDKTTGEYTQKEDITVIPNVLEDLIKSYKLRKDPEKLDELKEARQLPSVGRERTSIFDTLRGLLQKENKDTDLTYEDYQDNLGVTVYADRKK